MSGDRWGTVAVALTLLAVVMILVGVAGQLITLVTR